VPFPREPAVETIYNDLLIGDVETVAEKLVAEIHATHPVHVCFSFKVGNTPHAAAMRSMELMIGEVKPLVEQALGTQPPRCGRVIGFKRRSASPSGRASRGGWPLRRQRR